MQITCRDCSAGWGVDKVICESMQNKEHRIELCITEVNYNLQSNPTQPHHLVCLRNTAGHSYLSNKSTWNKSDFTLSELDLELLLLFPFFFWYLLSSEAAEGVLFPQIPQLFFFLRNDCMILSDNLKDNISHCKLSSFSSRSGKSL